MGGVIVEGNTISLRVDRKCMSCIHVGSSSRAPYVGSEFLRMLHDACSYFTFTALVYLRLNSVWWWLSILVFL
jgi:hypothetical protein